MIAADRGRCQTAPAELPDRCLPQAWPARRQAWRRVWCRAGRQRPGAAARFALDVDTPGRDS